MGGTGVGQSPSAVLLLRGTADPTHSDTVENMSTEQAGEAGNYNFWASRHHMFQGTDSVTNC